MTERRLVTDAEVQALRIADQALFGPDGGALSRALDTREALMEALENLAEWAWTMEGNRHDHPHIVTARNRAHKLLSQLRGEA